MNRRDFVRRTAILAATAALPGRGLSAAAGGHSRSFKVALTPGSIGVAVTSQRELNDLALRHGFEAVEPRPDELAAMSATQISEALADLTAKKLAWAAAALPVDFRKDDALFREGLVKLPAIAAGLQRAGVRRMGTWLMPSSDSLTYRANFRQHALRLAEVARVLRDYGLGLGLEYVGTQTLWVRGKYPFVHTLAETRELIAEIGTGNVGLVLDTWHWWQAGDTVADLLTLKNADVVSVDLNDAPQGVAKNLQKDGERELPASTGVIDAAAFLTALVTLGYDGPVRAEPFNKALNALENEPACAAVAAAMRRAVALLKS